MSQWTNTTTYIQKLNTQLPVHGQVSYPAVQVASADANTNDDYEEGTWTPTLTFATVGNLSVVYSTRYGEYTKNAREVILRFNVQTSTFTHTTASGNCQITGIPFNSSNTTGVYSCGSVASRQGITKANYHEVVATLQAAAPTLVQFTIAGSGQVPAFVATGDMPTGGTVILISTLPYRV